MLSQGETGHIDIISHKVNLVNAGSDQLCRIRIFVSSSIFRPLFNEALRKGKSVTGNFIS